MIIRRDRCASRPAAGHGRRKPPLAPAGKRRLRAAKGVRVRSCESLWMEARIADDGKRELAGRATGERDDFRMAAMASSVSASRRWPATSGSL